LPIHIALHIHGQDLHLHWLKQFTKEDGQIENKGKVIFFKKGRRTKPAKQIYSLTLPPMSTMCQVVSNQTRLTCHYDWYFKG
jgi:hypothetical protein